MDEVLEMLNKKMFDILFLSETKIDDTTSDSLLNQPNYRLLRRDRKKGAGGLIACVIADLSVYRRRKLEPKEVESICLDMSKTLTIIVLLFAPAIDLRLNVKWTILSLHFQVQSN